MRSFIFLEMRSRSFMLRKLRRTLYGILRMRNKFLFINHKKKLFNIKIIAFFSIRHQVVKQIKKKK